MILDHTGTEFRGGRVRLPKDRLFHRDRLWWEPDTEDIKLFVIRAIALVAGHRAIIWQGNFFELSKALSFWQSLKDGIGPTPREWDFPTPSWHPGLIIPGLVYEFATIDQFTTVGNSTWTAPASVNKIDYLVVSPGGGGGGCTLNAGTVGGGGGAGGVLTATGSTVTPNTGYSTTVAAGAAGGSGQADGSTAGNCLLQTFANPSGGGGGGSGSAVAVGNNGLTGGSGGGGGGGTGANSGGGVVGGGGGAGNIGAGQAGGGIGGGGGGWGSAGSGSSGGSGQTSSITGSTYAAGGASSTAYGLGVTPTAKANNTGNGGDGGWGANGGTGGSGIVVVSYNPLLASLLRVTNQAIKRAAYW